jgi:hypothetical protein
MSLGLCRLSRMPTSCPPRLALSSGQCALADTGIYIAVSAALVSSTLAKSIVCS